MVRLTLISRVHDGLPLAEGLDNEKDRDLDQYKLQAKVEPLTSCIDAQSIYCVVMTIQSMSRHISVLISQCAP